MLWTGSLWMKKCLKDLMVGKEVSYPLDLMDWLPLNEEVLKLKDLVVGKEAFYPLDVID